MAFQFHKIPGFAGLSNRRDARDIGTGLSKAQNISLDVGGKIRTIGGLEDFTKVDGTTALTQTAKIAPGSGLFTYGSDHWRGGSETVVDLLPNNNAVSDQQTEANATTGWEVFRDAGGAAFSSDTPANFGIAASGTTYVLGVVGGSQNATMRISSAITTVAGQRYTYSINVLLSTGTLVDIYIGTVIGTFDLASQSMTTVGSWTNVTGEFIATTTTTYFEATRSTASDNFYIDSAYITRTPRRDLDTNWLALLDAATAQVDLYNINDDSFTAGLLDFGTVSSFVGASAGNVDFPTVNTITDSASTFLNQGVQAGDVRIVSGCSTTAANNIMFVVEHVSNTGGTITARGSPFTVTASEAGTVTLTKYNPVAFHYVNEALRASPANGGVALRPKHYSFADRTHFEGATASEKKFVNWFANDVGPVKPTDISAEADAGDQDASALSAGEGWEVGISTTADDGEWTAGTYVIACSFIYDDGQESALYVPSTDEEFGTAIVDGDSLTITARGKNDYDERISGGRVYCRIDESDDPWTLLVDISIAKGARATLSGTYNAWAESATADVAYTAAFKSLKQNLDSYESLAGIDPTTNVEDFATDGSGNAVNNKFWNTSVIARNRCFIGSVRYTAEGGSLAHFRDRILYSTAGAYDTFPIDNYIDVVQGDAEDYVKLGIYGNDLLCYKQRTLYIVDISDPDPAGWQMKQDTNKGKYPFRGIAHPGAYFETPHGLAWCNEFGVFLYNGNEIVELLKDKIELSEHPLAYQRYYKLTTNDYIEVDDHGDFSFGDGATDSAFSIFVEVYMNDATLFRMVVKDDGGDNTEWAFHIQSADKLDWSVTDESTDGYIRILSNAAMTSKENGWHTFGATYDGGGAYTDLAVYADGDLEASADASSGSYTAMEPLSANVWIGRTISHYASGNFAHVIIFSKELSSAEMTDLHNGKPASAVGSVVAEWKPNDIGDATWTEAGGSHDGTVYGATAIKEDSWQSFYTDYSILGYHARTNQLIIMRDCTGRWSSGADYGDAWIIDLDTGASTTGRRVFTAKIPYSNFSTDWNQELIIAEQTSSTSVTIKRWTDEPQSQAVGLIDIRTADYDLNNPATAAFFDAFITWYKSSAAQTTPVSFATNGNDSHTAWTRLTGNFSAIEIWKKLSLQPTPITVDTIRFKLDNPTNASTMELNDIALRFDEQEADID